MLTSVVRFGHKTDLHWVILAFVCDAKTMFVCRQICTFDNHPSEQRRADRHLARNVAWNYFTAPCQSWATSTKSSLILALPDRQGLFDERRVDVFPPPACSRRLFVLVFVHMDVRRWKDFDCLWKYLEHSKYLRHRSWCGENTYIWEHSQVIRRYKTNGRRERKKETLAARRDDLRGNLSLFWAVSMRQSRPPNVLNMDVCIMKRAELGMTSLNSVFVHQRIQKALWEKH